ncbi:MAG: molecular chaperone HtpG [Clostridia bacterium]|nr:molecular chaperone HtpG [Clostridia bacterium]
MAETLKRSGNISVETQNIFPVIKKWLYSDKEIFVRELVSNACDAVTKHKRLVSLGEASEISVPYRIDVTLDTELGTLTVSDNGIGMSADEIDRYINQIALSGALDFIEKYEGKGEDDGNGIIGHFGLGFYSAFMIADKVELISKSHAGGATTKWIGSDSCEYTMEDTDDREIQGTDVILYINDDEKEFLDGTRIKSILDKFCAFMPVEIYFTDVAEEEKAKKEAEEKSEENKEEKPVLPINDTTPLWQKKPSECTEEEYIEFYKKVFNDYKEPLFYVHINADYPLNFKGILYFPRINPEFGAIEGQVKLYYNQVFVADNIKEVIPDYLMIMKGVLDCPELPLNVSRSYLQSNGYVNKISAHIVKKICDKLNSLFNLEREKYENMWHDIKPFVEYGCMKDAKFYDRVKDIILFKTTDDKFVTVKECTEAEGFDNEIYYTDDALQQSRYISMFRNESIQVVSFDSAIDTQFISFLESKFISDEALKDVKFSRVDAGISKALRADGETTENTELCEYFKKTLGLSEEFKITAERLKDTEVPAMLNLTEQSRRFSEMMKMYSGGEGMGMPVEETLVLNMANPLIEKLSASFGDESRKDINEAIVKQVYSLALLAQRPLSAQELRDFISGSAKLYGML